jgi:hypothetical protein
MSGRISRGEKLARPIDFVAVARLRFGSIEEAIKHEVDRWTRFLLRANHYPGIVMPGLEGAEGRVLARFGASHQLVEGAGPPFVINELLDQLFSRKLRE